jgi:hypothetical protein
MNMFKKATVCDASALFMFEIKSKLAGNVSIVQKKPNTIAATAAPIIICDN